MQMPAAGTRKNTKRAIGIVSVERLNPHHQLASLVAKWRTRLVSAPDGRMPAVPVDKPDATLGAGPNFERRVLAARHDVAE